MSSRFGSHSWMFPEDSEIGRRFREAVQRLSVSALRYTRYVRDPSVVAECLEAAAGSVLKACRGKLERVQNLDAYLLRAFAHKIGRHIASERKLVRIEYAEQIAAPD